MIRQPAAVLLLVLLGAVPVSSAAQKVPDPGGWVGPETLATVVDSFRVEPGKVSVQLSRSPVLELLELRVDGEVWPAPETVRLTRSTGLLVLPFQPDKSTALVVRYRYDPALLPGFAVLRELLPAASDSSQVAPAEALGLSTEPNQHDPSLGRLRIEGTKTVSVQSGTNRDATVDQGLNLAVSGPLTETIRVRAAISDDNLPITPEGNTEELRDLDQVRIELFGPRGRAVVGDFRVDQPMGAFVPYQRKLQGIDLLGLDRRGQVEVFGGAPKGSRIETEFFGREAVQGPYEIVDGRRLDQSFIVAGSERVWVDGQAMVRGTDRDYTIDYIRGTVRFTERRPILALSRIAVDFELSDSAWRRNVFSARTDSVGFGGVRFGVGFLRDGEDRNRPRGQPLTEEEVAALESAGDDASQAISLGVVATLPGEGAYVERFTTGGERYFLLADSTGGNFDVNFRFVGQGQGEYTLDGATETGARNFVFRGAGGGDYTVGRQLALPSRTDAAVFRGMWGGGEERAHLAAEIDITDHDANRFSALDDGDNSGSAWKLSARSPLFFGDPDEGTGVRLQGRAERIGERFFALGRLREAFFYQDFNLQDAVRGTDEDFAEVEFVAESSVRKVEAGWQRLDWKDVFNANRFSTRGSGTVAGPLHWDHLWSRARTRREAERSGSREDRKLGLRWQASPVVPWLRYTREKFENFLPGRAQGFRSDQLGMGLQVGSHGQLSLSREYADSLRTDASGWSDARDTWMARGQTAFTAGRSSLDADLTWRNSRFPEGADEVTRLARIRAGWRDPAHGLTLDTGYRISNDTSRVLSRQVVFVGLGKGEYDIEGNALGPGRGDYDLLYTPSDSTVTSTIVEFDTQVDLRSGLGWTGGLSNSTLFSVREQSRTDEVGRLLRLDPGVLRQPGSTIFGERRLRNDLGLLRKVRRLDLRYVAELQDLLDQRFVEGPQESRRLAHEVRLEGQFSGRWSGRVEAMSEARRRSSKSELNPLLQAFDVQDVGGLAALRWRHGTRARLELALRYTDRAERKQSIDQSIWSVEPTFNLNAIGARWTVNARLAKINESAGPDPVRPYFFEAPGSSRSAGLQAQWGASGRLSLNARYQITDEPGRLLRQDLGVETRARF